MTGAFARVARTGVSRLTTEDSRLMWGESVEQRTQSPSHQLNFNDELYGYFILTSEARGTISVAQFEISTQSGTRHELDRRVEHANPVN